MKYLFCVFSLILSQVSWSQNIKLEVEGIRTNKGVLYIGIFKTEESFKQEKPEITFKIPKTEMKNGKVVYSFELAEGVYGLTLLDDENDNEKMDYNFFGLPVEGFGFSDYYHSGMKRPRFEWFSFKALKGSVKKISVKIKYI